MALITCTECGKAFSDKAPACPNCGCPTSEIISSAIRTPNPPPDIITFDIDRKIYEPNKTAINIAIQKGIIENESQLIISCGTYYDSLFASYLIYVTEKNFYLCQFDVRGKLPDIITPVNYSKDTLQKFGYNRNLERFDFNKNDFGFKPEKIGELNKKRKWATYLEILKRIDPDSAIAFYNMTFNKGNHPSKINQTKKNSTTYQPMSSSKSSKNILFCPKCNGHNIDLWSNSANMKEFQRTGLNLNPLHPLTPYKTKTIKKEKKSAAKIGLGVMTGGVSLLVTGTKKKAHNEYYCRDCGNRWIGK